MADGPCGEGQPRQRATSGSRQGPGRGQGAVHGGATPGRRTTLLPAGTRTLDHPSLGGSHERRSGQGRAQLAGRDLVVCGSVVVNREGARVGKGGGFSDLEVAFLVEAGVLRPNTVLATTVHPLQVVDEPLPETVHDFRVDLIATPDAVIWCGQPRRPPGILWEHLHREKIAAIPVLEALAAQR